MKTYSYKKFETLKSRVEDFGLICMIADIAILLIALAVPLGYASDCEWKMTETRRLVNDVCGWIVVASIVAFPIGMGVFHFLENYLQKCADKLYRYRKNYSKVLKARKEEEERVKFEKDEHNAVSDILVWGTENNQVDFACLIASNYVEYTCGNLMVFNRKATKQYLYELVKSVKFDFERRNESDIIITSNGSKKKTVKVWSKNKTYHLDITVIIK